MLAAWIALALCAPLLAQTEKLPATEAEPHEAATSPENVALPAEDGAKPGDASEPVKDASKTPDVAAKPKVDRHSPRATIQSFMVAVQGSGDRPELMADAVVCLDTSKIEGDDRDQWVLSLARRLHFVIDKLGLQLEDIPEEYDQPFYVFKTITINDADDADDADEYDIVLRADADLSEWFFSADTIALVPAMYEYLSKTVEETSTSKDSDVPVARRTPRATMGTFKTAMDSKPPDFATAIACLDPSGSDPGSWDAVGKNLVVRLKNVIDKKRLVVLADIPEAPAENEYVWFADETGSIVLHKIAETGSYPKDWAYAPTLGEWRFSSKTLQTIDALYKSLENESLIKELRDAGKEEALTFGMRVARAMPPWLRGEFSGLQGWQWVALLALGPIGWLVKRIVSILVGWPLNAWLRRNRIDLELKQRRSATHSIGAVAAVLGWHIGVQQLDLPPVWLKALIPITQFAFAMATVWAGYRLVDVIGGYITANKDIRLTEIDEVLVPLLSKILRIFIVVLVILFVLNWAGYTTTTVLGALGVGGVAIAFASQDTLGNFFGSITVLFDRPFNIGDWIVVGKVEGTVERVGFRSTRVRTFYNSVVTIPNSSMVNSSVDNYGARKYRRIRTMLSVAYGTPPDAIDAFCEGVRELIRLHPYMRKDYYHVYFNQFAASSLDILLYAFLEVPDWGTELRERHRLFNDIHRLANRLGVEFAFPTQTLHLMRGEKVVANLPPGVTDGEQVGIEAAAQIFEGVYDGDAFLDPVEIDQKPRSRKDKA